MGMLEEFVGLLIKYHLTKMVLTIYQPRIIAKITHLLNNDVK